MVARSSPDAQLSSPGCGAVDAPSGRERNKGRQPGQTLLVFITPLAIVVHHARSFLQWHDYHESVPCS